MSTVKLNESREPATKNSRESGYHISSSSLRLSLCWTRDGHSTVQHVTIIVVSVPHLLFCTGVPNKVDTVCSSGVTVTGAAPRQAWYGGPAGTGGRNHKPQPLYENILETCVPYLICVCCVAAPPPYRAYTTLRVPSQLGAQLTEKRGSADSLVEAVRKHLSVTDQEVQLKLPSLILLLFAGFDLRGSRSLRSRSQVRGICEAGDRRRVSHDGG